MVRCCRVVGWLVGLIALVVSLLTLCRLMLMLSTQSSVSQLVPCCAPFFSSLVWNIVLLALFVLQHSGMSSDAWKNFLIRVGIDGLLHRPLYVICSCAILHLIIFQQSVLPGPLLWYFDVDEYPKLWLAVFIIHCLMWLIICAGAIARDPMELIGLKQLYDSAESKEQTQAVDDRMRSRHVGVAAFLVILWVLMAMSVERFLLAMVWTLYVLFGQRASPFAVYVVAAETKEKQT